MKQFVVKILIVVCVLPFTPVKELVKAPLLLIHYIEHIENLPNMSFSEFFNIHYRQGIQYDEDYNQDMQLPFKSLEYTHLPFFIFPENSNLKINEIEIGYDTKSIISTYYRFIIKDPMLQGVFHPPQSVATV